MDRSMEYTSGKESRDSDRSQNAHMLATRASGCETLYAELTGADDVRFVKILPGSWNAPIVCNLITAELSLSHGAYQALSYVWGRSRSSTPILVNGHNVTVTTNLELALRLVRHAHRNTIFWIDAICIDQFNPSERNHQVARMGQIYANATNVVAVLGHPWSHHPNARMLIERHICAAAESIDETCLDFRDKEQHELLSCSVPCEEDLKEPTPHAILLFMARLSIEKGLLQSVRADEYGHYQGMFEGICALMNSAWWTRVWILQEIIIPDRAIILFGSASIQWTTLCTILRPYKDLNADKDFPAEYRNPLQRLSKLVLGIEEKRQEWRAGTAQNTLFSLLREVGGRQATDNRDHVNAILGLVGGQTHIKADYDLNVAETYAAATLDIISRDNGSLRSLYGDLTRKGIHTLPSWVPDWSMPEDESEIQRAPLRQLLEMRTLPHPTCLSHRSDHAFRQITLSFEEYLLHDLYYSSLAKDSDAFECRCSTVVGSLQFWSQEQRRVFENGLPRLIEANGACNLVISPPRSSQNANQHLKLFATLTDTVAKVYQPIYPTGHDISAEARHRLMNIMRQTEDLLAVPSHLIDGRKRVGLFSLSGWNADAWDLVRTLIWDTSVTSEGGYCYYEEDVDNTLVRQWVSSRLHQVTLDDSLPEVAQYSKLDEIFIAGSSRRRLIKTKHGKWGWGPLSIKVDDVVHRLDKNPMPFVFRHEPGHPSGRRLVGDCYLLDGTGCDPDPHEGLTGAIKIAQTVFLDGLSSKLREQQDALRNSLSRFPNEHRSHVQGVIEAIDNILAQGLGRDDPAALATGLTIPQIAVL